MASIELFATKNPKFDKNEVRMAKLKGVVIEFASRREALLKPLEEMNKRELVKEDEKHLEAFLDYLTFLYQLPIRLPNPPKATFQWSSLAGNSKAKSDDWSFDCLFISYSSAILAFNLSQKKLQEEQVQEAKELTEKSLVLMDLVVSLCKEKFLKLLPNWGLSLELIEGLIVYFKARVLFMNATQLYNEPESGKPRSKGDLGQEKEETWSSCFLLLIKADELFSKEKKLSKDFQELRQTLSFQTLFSHLCALMEKAKRLNRAHKAESPENNSNGNNILQAWGLSVFLKQKAEESLKESKVAHNERAILAKMFNYFSSKHTKYQEKKGAHITKIIADTGVKPLPPEKSLKTLLSLKNTHLFQVLPELREDILKQIKVFDSPLVSEILNKFEQEKTTEITHKYLTQRSSFEERVLLACESMGIDRATNEVKRKETPQKIIDKFMLVRYKIGQNPKEVFRKLNEAFQIWKEKGVLSKANIEGKIRNVNDEDLDEEKRNLKKNALVVCKALEECLAAQVGASPDFLNDLETFANGPDAFWEKLTSEIEGNILKKALQVKTNFDQELFHFRESIKQLNKKLQRINIRLLLGHSLVFNKEELITQIIQLISEETSDNKAIIEEKSKKVEPCLQALEAAAKDYSGLPQIYEKIFSRENKDFSLKLICRFEKLKVLKKKCEKNVNDAINLNARLNVLFPNNSSSSAPPDFENDQSWMTNRNSENA